MTTTHTPGQWTVRNDIFATVHDANGDRIATVAASLTETQIARLIAAAPDLLQVAIAFCDITNPQELEERGYHDMAELCRMARAAIAKATGGAA